ncbi:MAG TPA: DNA cytosine methyltransferase [Burkholderiaceae bacterium]
MSFDENRETVPTKHAPIGAISQSSAFWVEELKKQSWPAPANGTMELRIADLFSGCGGLSLGASIASAYLDKKLKIALAADSWAAALDVYRHNFRDCLETSTAQDLAALVVSPGSVTLSKQGMALADSIGDVDIVLAGPPCQGHSDLNNSSRRDDPRNLLYTVPVAFGLCKQAKLILVENVPNVIHSKKGVVRSALATLRDQGYAVSEFVADAQDVGLPQTRRRHILIASTLHSMDELSMALQMMPRRAHDVRLWDFIDDLEHEAEIHGVLAAKRSNISEVNRSRIDYLFKSDSYDLPNRLRPPCHKDKEHSYVSMYGRLNPNLPAQTITSGFGSMGQGRFVHPTQRRMITAHEAARIQGFPDYFHFEPVSKLTALREMIGNAVAPPVAATLIVQLLAAVLSRNGGALTG